MACRKRRHIPVLQQIALVGIGMGERNGMTLEAQQAVQEADLVIGAGRMVEAAAGEGAAYGLCL